jgi:tetratricopeptide (TPR) repeat protein
MKIAVYAISKNEEQFVKTWSESCKEADHRFVLDTGSTDKTVKALKASGVETFSRKFTPWRFDAARNLSLALLPSDIDWCIALDLDEQLRPGWRDVFEKTVEGTEANRFRYEYVWSWKAEGIPDLIYFGDKIHRRHTHYWAHPVHEVLLAKQNRQIEVFCDAGPLIEHHPDPSKSRGDYLPLLKLSVEENPDDDRNAHYYGRELYYRERWHEAIHELQRHLALPSATWKAERAWSMRYIAECHIRLGNYDVAKSWMESAVREEPNTRDLWCFMAQLCHDRNEWEQCEEAAKNALSINERGKTYMSEAKPWGSWPFHLLSIAQWNTGKKSEAIVTTEVALSVDPDNSVLQGNLKIMRELTACSLPNISEQPLRESKA